MLFDDKERTRTTPKKPGERDYDFYDSSASAGYQVYRDLLNGWIAELPEAERNETINRFRKGDNLAYRAVLAELTIHAALIRQGCTVEVHPPCPHPTNRPDFLAKDADGKSVAYIEVTSFGPGPDDVARSNREAQIYNAIDKAKLPAGFRLGYDVVEYGQKSPSLNKLCRSIETWAAARVVGYDQSNSPVQVFDAEDWKIELTLIGGFKAEGEVDRAIARAMGDARQVTPAIEIREALKKKGSRYGVLEAPFVIAVADFNDELVGGEHNNEALIDSVFGSVVTQVTGLGTPEENIVRVRIGDGYWGVPGGLKHTGVSGAILLPQPNLWSLRADRWQPLMIRNPWATHLMPDALLPLPGLQLNSENAFEAVEGTKLADILGLPAIWPPENPAG
jgi:hypothetical protein